MVLALITDALQQCIILKVDLTFLFRQEEKQKTVKLVNGLTVRREECKVILVLHAAVSSGTVKKHSAMAHNNVNFLLT